MLRIARRIHSIPSLPFFYHQSCHLLLLYAGTEGIGLLAPEKIEELQKIVAKLGTHEAADFIIKQVLEHPSKILKLYLFFVTGII